MCGILLHEHCFYGGYLHYECYDDYHVSSYLYASSSLGSGLSNDESFDYGCDENYFDNGFYDCDYGDVDLRCDLFPYQRYA